MGLEELVAAVALVGVIVYAVLGGADFGGGIWDLFAAGPRRFEQRAAIAEAMGPVWEANHVWLIFVIVVVFTAFPPAFAALSVGMFGLFHFVLLGITLRGAAFVFRGPQIAEHGRSAWGTIFGIASVITPVLLGMVAGAVSSGDYRVINGHVQIGPSPPWFAPEALAMGSLALALCAYLAAVYLCVETAGELQQDFRRRALLAGTAVVGLAGLTLPLLYREAPHLWNGLISRRAAPVVACGIVAALISGWTLLRGHFQIARLSAIVQVALLVMGWGLAHYPYIIYPDVALQDAAAPTATLQFVLVSFGGGLALLLPSLWLLFRVFKGQ